MWNTIKKYLYCIFIAVNLVKSCACEGTVEAKLNSGIVLGKVQKTFLNEKPYNVFKGIPYAEPPINELRFKVK